MGRVEPIRTCVACRTRRNKAALVRVVRRPDGSVEMDADGRLDGRGAYLCADGACWQLARQRSALERALRTSLPMELRTRLESGDTAGTRVALDQGTLTTVHGGTDGA